MIELLTHLTLGRPSCKFLYVPSHRGTFPEVNRSRAARDIPKNVIEIEIHFPRLQLLRRNPLQPVAGYPSIVLFALKRGHVHLRKSSLTPSIDFAQACLIEIRRHFINVSVLLDGHSRKIAVSQQSERRCDRIGFRLCYPTLRANPKRVIAARRRLRKNGSSKISKAHAEEAWESVDNSCSRRGN
jgi:hypothetical protein